MTHYTLLLFVCAQDSCPGKRATLYLVPNDRVTPELAKFMDDVNGQHSELCTQERREQVLAFVDNETEFSDCECSAVEIGDGDSITRVCHVLYIF